jgi:hypothetical protein
VTQPRTLSPPPTAAHPIGRKEPQISGDSPFPTLTAAARRCVRISSFLSPSSSLPCSCSRDLGDDLDVVGSDLDVVGPDFACSCRSHGRNGLCFGDELMFSVYSV